MANVPFIRTTARDLAASAIAWYLGLSQSTAGRLTDMNPGSVVRTLLETIAIQLEQENTAMFVGLERAIPIVLYDFFGEGDGVTTFVGFPALPALPAIGPVRFTRVPGVVGEIPIAAGSRLALPGTISTSERLYTTLVPAVIAAGADYVETLAQASVAGPAGNVAANALRFKDFGPSPEPLALGNVTATNPAAFLSGKTAETDEERRVRFAAYLRNLARAQHGGLEVAARSAQVVTAGVVLERCLSARSLNVPDKRGLVDCYIDNGGGGASSALVAVAQRLIDGDHAPDGTPIPGFKAAGDVVRVKAVVPQIVNVDLAIATEPGFDFGAVQAAVASAVGVHLFGLGVFQDLVLSELVAVVQNVRGVYDVAIATPATNLTTQFGARILPGTVAVGAL